MACRFSVSDTSSLRRRHATPADIRAFPYTGTAEEVGELVSGRWCVTFAKHCSKPTPPTRRTSSIGPTRSITEHAVHGVPTELATSVAPRPAGHFQCHRPVYAVERHPTYSAPCCMKLDEHGTVKVGEVPHRNACLTSICQVQRVVPACATNASSLAGDCTSSHLQMRLNRCLAQLPSAA